MSKYLLILFLFFMPFFFLGVELCYFFFSFLFTPFFSFFFFFFFFGVALFFLFLLFSVLEFYPFSFWGVPNLFFLFLVSFPCFLFSSSSHFGVRHFSFFFLIGAAFVLLVFGLFFLGVELCCFFFFFLFFSRLPFFGGGVALFFFFRCWTFFFFFLGGCRICSSCFWSLFLVSYFLGPCVFSLSPSIAWTSRSKIDSFLFLAASLIVFVEPW